MSQEKQLNVITTIDGLFFYLRQQQDMGEKIFIPFSTPLFHEIVYKLSQIPKYQKLFSELLWQKRTFGFYCEEIEDILSSLTMSRMIHWINDNSNVRKSYYVINDKLINCWRKYKKISIREETQLRDLALDFIQLSKQKQ